MTPTPTDERLRLAERAARAAGALLAASSRQHAVRLVETARDVTIDLDRAAEDRICGVLEAASRFPILGEERWADGAAAPSTGQRWIIDPLDGTMNFVQGIPFCCVSVALWDNNDPIAAAVYDFDRDEMFSALTGAGAWLNGSAIRVSAAPPDRGVLCTGFPAATDFSAEALSRLVAQIRLFRKIRLLGSAALSLAYVAAGRADAYFERDIRVWDVAGGLALVHAAGGVFSCAPSHVPHANTVYAHNGACPWQTS